jgi:inner membrane transporter RhtA
VKHGRQGPAIGLVLGAIVSVQAGAAVATTLFDELGPTGTVMLRIVLGALVLIAIWRPSLSGLRGTGGRQLVLFGITLAAMNTAFYLALDRIPLGIAVTLEFVGPLAVAILASRHRLDLLWAAMAGIGILLLTPLPGSELDLLGCALAVLAGGFWGAYIVVADRVGQAFPGGQGLAMAMAVAAALLLGPGIADAGSELLSVELLAVGFAVAILSSVIPYSLELEALRRLPRGTFGVLMSLEPAVAATIGLIGLDQDLSPNEILAIGLVVIASAGALRSAPVTVET